MHHLWVLIAVAAVIGRLLNKGKDSETSGKRPAPPKEFQGDDPELAERTRKIRDEIQRKIAERRGQRLPPPALPPAPSRPAVSLRAPEATTPPRLRPENLREVLSPKPAPVSPPVSPRMLQANVAEEAERQRALVEKLTEARLMKEAALKRAVFQESLADKEPAALQLARVGLLEDVRSPQALRRAFVLREVLGPPVALR